MKLRRWQSACLTKALKRFENYPHFMCLATPGSGKTRLAAALAQKLMHSGQIDFVLCFAPSVEVALSMASTFTEVLGRRFDGQLGAIGGAYTYQSLLSIPSEFWQIFDSYRVLVVLDEVHHCAGSDLSNANCWGQSILSKIQNRARFSLALSGTPWRSDDLPIVLAKYSDPEGKVRCDFEYGLAQAIKDGVCRNPKIVLIDHDQIRITNGKSESKSFESFEKLLNSRSVSYDDLIHDLQAIRFMLKRGCQKLKEIRHKNPRAAGLVVARSVEHAHTIAAELSCFYGQSVKVVTYKEPDAGNTIDEFRHSDDQWIVSVGMISEGTDIPRLQVCCHLSIIKTEMHFRQVLGRILRMTNDDDKTAWMFTFAEPTLTKFAQGLAQDIPDSRVVEFDTLPLLQTRIQPKETFRDESVSGYKPSLQIGIGSKNSHVQHPALELGIEMKVRPQLEWMGHFREQVISTFNSPF